MASVRFGHCLTLSLNQMKRYRNSWGSLAFEDANEELGDFARRTLVKHHAQHGYEYHSSHIASDGYEYHSNHIASDGRAVKRRQCQWTFCSFLWTYLNDDWWPQDASRFIKFGNIVLDGPATRSLS
eukprot:5899758-Amphidinium_carterae.1